MIELIVIAYVILSIWNGNIWNGNAIEFNQFMPHVERMQEIEFLYEMGFMDAGTLVALGEVENLLNFQRYNHLLMLQLLSYEFSLGVIWLNTGTVESFAMESRRLRKYYYFAYFLFWLSNFYGAL